MSTYMWKSWGGGRCQIDADSLTFEPGHVVFWRKCEPGGTHRILVLAVDNANIHDLTIKADE